MTDTKEVERIVEERWHNWVKDPEFWKKDIIDTFTDYANARVRDVVAQIQERVEDFRSHQDPDDLYMELTDILTSLSTLEESKTDDWNEDMEHNEGLYKDTTSS
jgi:predicted methyltransferase